MIGIGDEIESKYMKCVTQSDSDFLTVSGYSRNAFDIILGSLSDILCPQSKEFKITEVKAQKKTTTNGLASRYGRFVEVYNTGVDFNVSDMSISGLISMLRGAGPDVTVLQGQYVVFYDAETSPYMNGHTETGSTPSCHLCEWDPTNNNLPCDLSGCPLRTDSYADTCFCANSIYIACGNADGYTNCESNVAISDNTNTYDACQACRFQDTYINGNQDTAVCNI